MFFNVRVLCSIFCYFLGSFGSNVFFRVRYFLDDIKVLW